MKTAVLVIDMQEALCAGARAAFNVGAVLNRINRITSQARAVGAPVVFIQHEEENGPLP